jgi:hypothetical protein
MLISLAWFDVNKLVRVKDRGSGRRITTDGG